MSATNLLAEMSGESQNSQMALVLAAQAQAEIQAACVMAKQSPRDWDVVRERILKECKRSTFAEVARYHKPIGKGIEGFSIRFAEAAIQASKHIHVTVRTIWEDDEVRKLLVKVWDAQEMISYADEITIEKTVERRSIDKSQDVLRTRKNKQGDLLYIIPATEDDLLNKVNAQKSKSIRTNGLRLIPGWILDECLRTIRETLNAEDEKNPDAAKQKILDAFGEMGVDVASIKKYLGHDAATLTPRELQELRALYQAIREGDTTMRAVLEDLDREHDQRRAADSAAQNPPGTVVASATSTTSSVRDKILARGKAQTGAPAPSPTSPSGAPVAAADKTAEVIPKTVDDVNRVVAGLQAKDGQVDGELFSKVAEKKPEGKK
jgi:hypothetical protein